jgi:hypothetical protein
MKQLIISQRLKDYINYLHSINADIVKFKRISRPIDFCGYMATNEREDVTVLVRRNSSDITLTEWGNYTECIKEAKIRNFKIKEVIF